MGVYGHRTYEVTLRNPRSVPVCLEPYIEKKSRKMPPTRHFSGKNQRLGEYKTKVFCLGNLSTLLALHCAPLLDVTPFETVNHIGRQDSC